MRLCRFMQFFTDFIDVVLNHLEPSSKCTVEMVCSLTGRQPKLMSYTHKQHDNIKRQPHNTAQLYKLIIGYMPTFPLFSSRSRRLGFNCRSIWLETDFSCGTHTFCHCTSPLTKMCAILSMLAAIVPLIYFIELITP